MYYACMVTNYLVLSLVFEGEGMECTWMAATANAIINIILQATPTAI
jgi:hypothetical protein